MNPLKLSYPTQQESVEASDGTLSLKTFSCNIEENYDDDYDFDPESEIKDSGGEEKKRRRIYD